MPKKFPDLLTLNGLATALDIERRTAAALMAKPGAPAPNEKGLYSTSQALAWCTRQGTGTRAMEGTDIQELRRQKLQIEVARSALALQKDRRDVVDLAEITPVLAAAQSGLTATLRQEFEMMMPSKCKGKGVAELQQMFADSVDRVLELYGQELGKL
jgi:hypothetical protein